jgi:NADH dehydrogenase
MLNATVVDMDRESVTVEHKGGERERIPTKTIIWAAGVTASKLATTLGGLTGGEVDRAGRVTVEPDLSLPGHPEVIALGDMVRVKTAAGDAVTFPGVAPVAMQQGRYAAEVISARLRSQIPDPFRYHDKGNLATIGRGSAVADIKGIRLSGFIAWLTWLMVHLFYLVGFANRIVVFFNWTVSFVTHGRGARLITAQATEDPSVHRAE